MVGRGAYGKPWLLAQVMAALDGRPVPDAPGLAEQRDLVLEHYEAMMELYGREHGVGIARKHLGWYTKGLPSSAEFRNKVNTLSDSAEVMAMLRDFYADQLERAALAAAAAPIGVAA
jgi:tRNA-dihydrouridine synthase B